MRQARLLVAALLLVSLAVVALEPPPVFLLKWGTHGSGDGQFRGPSGVAVDASGNVYVAETENFRIQKFDSNGNYLTQWGSWGTGDGQFDWARGGMPEEGGHLAADASGNVYVVDKYLCRVQKFDSNGTFLGKWGTQGSGDGQLNDPTGIAVDVSGYVYVVDTWNYRIQKFDSDGVFVAKWGSSGTGNGQFNFPWGVAVDATGHVYVTDNGNHRVQKFDGNGNFLGTWGSLGSGDGELIHPTGIAVDTSGHVYVVGPSLQRIQKFDGNGTFLTKWQGGFNWFENGGLAVDAWDRVYVADTYNHQIQVFAPPPEPPVFQEPTSPEHGSTFDWPAGKLLAFDVEVVDGNAGDTVTLEAIDLPAGAVLTPGLPLSGNPVLAGFAWTPEAEDAGANVITLRATDGVGHEVDFTFTMNVKGDSDGDGLSDLWEMEGYTAPNGEYVPLHQMGADPNHKDIFVDVDYMVGEATNYFGTLVTFDHRPFCAALDEIKATFAAAPVSNPDGTTGITLHVRVAQQADCSSPSVTSRVPFAEILGSEDAASNYLWTAPPGSPVPHFDDLKGAPGIFPEELGYAAHYCVFAHQIPGRQTGISRGLDAGDFIVSLGSYMVFQYVPAGSTVTADPEAQAGTFMHELGHNLDLDHGGADGLRRKPNYLSVMNKDYFQMSGLIIEGKRGEIGGDLGSGASRRYHFDFSREALPGWPGNLLDETHLDESVGLQGSAAMDRYGTIYYSSGQDYEVAGVNDPIDWIPDGQVEVVSMDVTYLNGLTVLAGHDDWSNLSYSGGRVGGGIVIPLPEVTPVEELTPEEAVEQIFAPETVEKLRGHVATKMLHLTWKPRGPGYSYNIRRSEDGGTPQLIGTTTRTNFKDRNVVKGVVYTYAVTAVDPVHGAESAAGETVSLQLRR